MGIVIMNKTLEDLKEDEIYYNEHIKQEYKRCMDEYKKETDTIEKIITIIDNKEFYETDDNNT